MDTHCNFFFLAFLFFFVFLAHVIFPPKVFCWDYRRTSLFIYKNQTIPNQNLLSFFFVLLEIADLLFDISNTTTKVRTDHGTVSSGCFPRPFDLRA